MPDGVEVCHGTIQLAAPSLTAVKLTSTRGDRVLWNYVIRIGLGEQVVLQPQHAHECAEGGRAVDKGFVSEPLLMWRC